MLVNLLRLGRPSPAAAIGHTGAPGAACVPPRARAPSPHRVGSMNHHLRAGAPAHLHGHQDAQPLLSAVRRPKATASVRKSARATPPWPAPIAGHPAGCSVRSCAPRPTSARHSCCSPRLRAPRCRAPAGPLCGRCHACALWCHPHVPVRQHSPQAVELRQGKRQTGAARQTAAGLVP